MGQDVTQASPGLRVGQGPALHRYQRRIAGGMNRRCSCSNRTTFRPCDQRHVCQGGEPCPAIATAIPGSQARMVLAVGPV